MASNLVLTACELCSQHFSDPRMLPCLHSFCFECLLKHFDSKKSGYSCPTCKEVFEVPDGKLEALTKDLYGSYVAEVADCEEKIKDESADVYCDRCIMSSESAAVKFCIGCCKFLCSWCTKDHARRQKTCKHEMVDVGEKKGGHQDKSLLNSIPRKVMNCQLHSDEILKFYCTTCSCLICRDCMALAHAGHSYDRTEAAAEREKTDLLAVIDEADDATRNLEDAMGKGDKVIQSIKTRQQSVDGEIKECFKNLLEALCRREEFLLAKSSEVGLSKITALMLQIEEMRKICKEISRVRERIKEAVDVYAPAEMMSVKKIMTVKLASLIQQYKACSLDPCKNDMISTKFETVPIEGEIDKLGIVTGGCYAPTSSAHIYVHQAIKGKATRVFVTTRDIQGDRFLRGGDVVRAKLRLFGTGDFYANGTVKDNTDGTYEVSMTPQNTGDHQLSITIGNEHVLFSPAVLVVREERPYTSQERLQSYDIPTPQGVSFSDTGEMFVVSYSSHFIQVLDQEGKNTRVIGNKGSSGSGKLQFNYPRRLAIRGEMVYVVDTDNHRVQKFTLSGEHVSTFGTNGSGEGQLKSPRGICIDPEGKIYISEWDNNRVSVFNADESFNRHISDKLSEPWGLAFDPAGNLHVANYGDNKIIKFGPEGEVSKDPEYTHDDIKGPSGIAFDPEGYMFVSSHISSGKLLIFDPEFQLVNTLSGFNYPAGVTLDKEGYFYVCDYSNGKVHKY